MHSYVALIYLVIPLTLMYMLFSRGRRQRRLQVSMQATITPGARVMTTSGLYATVVSLPDERTAVLEIAPGVHTTWVRLAIAQVLEAESAAAPADPERRDDDDARTEARTEARTDALTDHDGRTLT